jgi:hypothetical protein
MTHKANDGGPAHPLPHPSQHIPGISVRDFFAAAALTGMFATEANPRIGTTEEPYQTSKHAKDFANAAYRLADAMMAERAK